MDMPCLVIRQLSIPVAQALFIKDPLSTYTVLDMTERVDQESSDQPPRKKMRLDDFGEWRFGYNMHEAYLSYRSKVEGNRISLINNSYGIEVVPWIRDARFYYEDGSVVLRVEDVLFKVQASLLKAHSEVFTDMFTMPPGDHNGQAEGSTDEYPIVIPGIKATEFRNLLKMLYIPPSDKFFVNLQSTRKSDTKSLRDFLFYSDVARLSHRFGMGDFEKWALGKLGTLVESSVNNVLAAVRKNMEDETDFDNSMDTLSYAVLVSDQPMEHNLRNAILHNSVSPETLSPSILLGLLHRPGLLEEEPAMFGFWFLAILNLGHSAWHQEPFTKQDRVALFSAQTHLTPLPQSLGEGLSLPIVVRIKPTKEGYIQGLGGLRSDSCRRRLSRAWRSVFSSEYYDDVLSREILKPTSMLCKLPKLRSEFRTAVGALTPCACYADVLRWLDEQMKVLFTRLAGYYQDID
ncbi:The BTB (BR-C, ttk and bab)/POZ (Pox virus and Zinc finger) domain [Ceratobasidium sp. AG-Ba]|nr:The BTB (BR-C, ttk and bab)/POZ (Pox virus and Zinc finger) domain [Ceratobasidium sp. AG-Ba]